MARMRTLKHEFFQHDGLSELPRDVRLMFAGLWTLADRDGRLVDRPKKIKFSLFPGDTDVTPEVVDQWLWALANHWERFVVRYEVDGERFIEVRNFRHHQRPHPHESPSEIPASDVEGSQIRVQGHVTASNDKSLRANLESGSVIASNDPPTPHTQDPIDHGSSFPESDARAKRRKRPAAASRVVPDDFEPNASVIAAGHAVGLDDETITEELVKFRDHEFKDPHVDWQRAARRWMRKAPEMRGPISTRAAPRFAAEVTADNGRQFMAESIAEDEQERATHDKA